MSPVTLTPLQNRDVTLPGSRHLAEIEAAATGPGPAKDLAARRHAEERRLLASENLNPEVKQRAQWALKQLQ